jgi:hypothetical protein
LTAIRHAAPAAFAAVLTIFSGSLDRAEAGAGAVAALAYRSPKPLSPWDAQIYAGAFEAVARGDFAGARQQASRVSDKALLAHLEQRVLLSAAYRASFTELSAWLEANAGLAGADRIYTLAKKRQPLGAPEPTAPLLRPQHSWAQLTAGPLPAKPAADRGQPARELFYKGETKAAYDMAVSLDERWIAGLAAFRLKNYAEAQSRFETLARDSRKDEWTRSGAAYWAARSAIAGGSPSWPRLPAHGRSPPHDLLRPDRRAPAWARALGSEGGAGRSDRRPTGPCLLRRPDGSRRAGREDPRARRAAALAQIGQMGEASVEIRSALTSARSEEARRQWIALATALNAPLATLQAPLDTDDYPTPVLNPARRLQPRSRPGLRHRAQESRFDPVARSHAGATGADAADAGRPRPTVAATTG